MENFKYFCNMKQHEEVTFQTLANNEDIQIGYSDNDIELTMRISRLAIPTTILWSLIVFSNLPKSIQPMWP